MVHTVLPCLRVEPRQGNYMHQWTEAAASSNRHLQHQGYSWWPYQAAAIEHQVSTRCFWEEDTLDIIQAQVGGWRLQEGVKGAVALLLQRLQCRGSCR